MSCAIRVEGLQKSYAGRAVLKGLTFTVEQGEIFALLGVNGAGKTTALECIEGLRRRMAACCGVGQGRDTASVRLSAGAHPALGGRGAVCKMERTKPVRPCWTHWASVGEKNAYGALSTGQKRRLHLALALTGRPDVVFLDEPTAGLDVEGRVALHAQIRARRRRGKPSSWPAMIWRRWKACAAASAS